MQSPKSASRLCTVAAVIVALCSFGAAAATGAESMPPTCDAGGAGAVKCQAAEDGCTISCASGQYACCNGEGDGSDCVCVNVLPGG